MNVTLADITAAYILVFGKELPKDLPYAKAAEQIRVKRDDWRYIMGAVAAAFATYRAARGEHCSDYALIAANANELIADFAKNAKPGKKGTKA
jgi:hypothetical protein